MSAERFMYKFVRALRANDTMAFKEKFRQIDVLLIDDIQFICGKKSTQQEFFHTFNALIDQGKQIVLSSNSAPSALNDIDDRLKSRLGMGLVAQVQNADYDLRLAILKSKCKLMNRDIPENVLTFLASKIAANIRETEGALNRLIAHSDLINKDITLAGAQEILHDLVQSNNRKITIDDIQKAVADHFNIRMSDILSPRRSRVVARPRQIAMYLCKYLTPLSLPDIGRGFAGRDHTTIIHGIRKIESLMTEDAKIATDVDALKVTLSSALS